MPTAKPRLNITLEPKMARLIERLAEGREVPRSRVITDLLDAVAPQLEGLAQLLETAKRAPQDLHQQLAATLARTHDQLAPDQGGIQLNIEDAIAHATATTTRSSKPL